MLLQRDQVVVVQFAGQASPELYSYTKDMSFYRKRPHSRPAVQGRFHHYPVMKYGGAKLCRLTIRTIARLLPQYCAFCRARIDDNAICQRCMDILPANHLICFRCGQPVSTALPDDVWCAHCQAVTPRFERARAPMIYDFPIDRALKSLKFNRQLWYVPAMAQLMLPLLDRDFGQCDALIPVPLHRWRHARRGFNQAIELCKPLRRATGLRILNDVIRTRPTIPQAGLSASERRKNLRDVFVVPDFLRCRRPLVVDDVITTGSTISQLTTALLRAGADSVNVLAVARVNQLGKKIGSGSTNV